MNILWITAVYPSPNSPAEGVFHRTQAEALAALGATVRVVAPIPWVPAFLGRMVRRWWPYANYPASYEENGVQVFRPRFFAHPRHFLYGVPHRFMAAAVRRLRIPKPDLIHAHIVSPCGLTARLVSKQWNIPYLLTLHGSDVHSYPQTNSQCHRRFLDVVKNAHSVIAVGSALARTTEQISGVRPTVKPIGIELENFGDLPGQAEARRILQLPANQYIVLYVGRLVEAKGIRELIEALRHKFSRPVMGVFAGDGPLYEKASAAQHVKAIGPVDNRRLPLYLAAADALALPSYKEGLPTVLVEAGASGLPVIATRIDGVVDLLGADRGHLIAVKSSAAIAEGIRHLMDNRAYAHNLASNLRRHVLEHYDVKKNARELLHICENAARRDCVPWPGTEAAA